MKRYVEKLIAAVKAERFSASLLADIEDALRLVRMRNYRALAPKLSQQGVTKAEARRLREAVYEASRSFLRAPRLALLLNCLRNGDRRVRAEVEREMARLAVAISEQGAALWQALIALADTGVDVFPPDWTGGGIDSYDDNMAAAMSYLGRRGLLGDHVRRFHRRRKAR
jgi:hypothetical protein